MQRRSAHWLRLLTLLLAASSTACIENRLEVDITTIVHADGSCTRRTAYRLERVDKEGTRFDIPPDQDDLLLLHRFPSSQAWTVDRDVKNERHSVTLEANLLSPNDIDWDYWRAATAKTPPARNHFSFAMDGDADNPSRYHYTETFVNPDSPLRSLRLVSELLRRKEDLFVREIIGRLQRPEVRRGDVTRAFRENLAIPLAREVAALTGRPVHGPRERREELETLLERFTALAKALADELAELVPGLDPEEAEHAVSQAFEAPSVSLEKEISLAGISPHFGWDPFSRIHFRVTLIMPAPIVRANTCAQGDTASWEFDAEDLFGRGFEMWAIASTAPSSEQ